MLILFTPLLFVLLALNELKRVLKGTIIIKLFRKEFKFYWDNPNKMFH